MDYIELDLALVRVAAGAGYLASARLRRPDGADQDLVPAPPPVVAPDLDILLALGLDPSAYGAELSRALFADDRLRQALAAARAAAGDSCLRIRLHLDPSDEALHSVRWETLADPGGGPPLAISERAVLSRYLEGERLLPIQRRPRGALRALAAVAGPTGLERFRLPPVDVAGELGRARAALGAAVRVDALASVEGRPCTLDNLLAALREGPDILYLVCHGTNRQGIPILWLEDNAGGLDRVEGAAFAERVAALPRPPTLVVLASCQSMGAGDDQRTLAALGPRLAAAGVAAVVAMQGNISQATVAEMMPVFFRELQRDGQIDRALAAARAAVLAQPDWWQPALFLRPRDGLIWGAITPPAPAASLADALTRRNRERMLQKVRSFWVEGVLEHSLHGVAMVDLGLGSRPDALTYPWETVIQPPAGPARPIPPEQDLVDVFDSFAGELLILGGPGSGKTTMLLDLARSLIARAESDPAHPIPVVFNLSTWGEGQRPLAEWMSRELELRYDVPRKVAAEWLRASALLPLFDGLDEVAEDRRRACVAAINAERVERAFYGIAVCSRSAEYAAIGLELSLGGAVEIAPLGAAQVDAFLAGAGEQLAALRGALQADPGLRELASTPVMLNAMALAYRGLRPEELPHLDTPAARRAHLFESYLRRMYERRPGRHSREQTLGWLGWLARAMAARSQTIFHIERLLPDWLEGRGELRVYTLLDRIGSGLVAALSIMIWVPLAPLAGEAVIEAVTLGLIAALYGPRAATAPRRLLASLLRGGLAALLIGLVVAGLNALLGLGTPIEGLAAIPMLAGIFGGLAALAGSELGLGPRPVQLIEALRWRWRRAWPAALRGAAIGAGAGLALALALIFLDATGLSPLFQSPGANGEPPLAGSQLIAAYVAALYQFPLIIAACLLPPWALLGGLVADSVSERTRPNEGIRRSARSALTSGGLALLIFAIIYLLLFLDAISPYVLLSALVLGIFGALPVALAYGGYACLSHLALRLILWRRGRIPWRLAGFLDEAAEQIYLRRVGGGYIFVHRLLLEHLAGRDPGLAPAPPFWSAPPEAPRPDR